MIEQFKHFIDQVSPLSKEPLEALYGCFHPVELKKNAFFAKEGETANQIGFLYSGIVRAYFVSAEGKEYNKQFFMSPSIIGAYASLLTKEPNRIAQQAMTDAKVLVAAFSDVERLYNQFHQLERLGRKISEYYFLQKEKKEIEMALLDASQRYLILRETFPQIEATIPQYHVASYLGITPTQLSRIRRNMTLG